MLVMIGELESEGIAYSVNGLTEGRLQVLQDVTAELQKNPKQFANLTSTGNRIYKNQVDPNDWLGNFFTYGSCKPPKK